MESQLLARHVPLPAPAAQRIECQAHLFFAFTQQAKFPSQGRMGLGAAQQQFGPARQQYHPQRNAPGNRHRRAIGLRSRSTCQRREDPRDQCKGYGQPAHGRTRGKMPARAHSAPAPSQQNRRHQQDCSGGRGGRPPDGWEHQGQPGRNGARQRPHHQCGHSARDRMGQGGMNGVIWRCQHEHEHRRQAAGRASQHGGAARRGAQRLGRHPAQNHRQQRQQAAGQQDVRRHRGPSGKRARPPPLARRKGHVLEAGARSMHRV